MAQRKGAPKGPAPGKGEASQEQSGLQDGRRRAPKWLFALACAAVAGVAAFWQWASLSAQPQREPELHFDISEAPPLSRDEELFPKEYQRRMRWGTYRPGTYFGVKGRHPNSLLFGLAWGTGKKLRHKCQSGELKAFGWTEHDGESYGLQELEDQDLQLRLRTTFVKDHERPDRIWHARIDAAPLAKSREVSLFVYFGVEADGDHLREQPRGDEPKWVQQADGSWRGSVGLSGNDPAMGPFQASVVLQVNSSGKAPTAWRRAAAQLPSERVESTEQATTGVWNAEKHLPRHFGRKAKDATLSDEVPEPANWWALQLRVNASALPRIDVHVEFGDPGEQQDADTLGASLSTLAERASQDFRKSMAAVFPAKPPFDGAEHRSAAGVAVAGLLGGIGYFHGRLLARTEPGGESLERLPTAALFSGVPSRSFFPRGFLWDEGFHGLLLVRWQPHVFLDVLAHWLELQRDTGWVPREVPLGAEQESRVPLQFLAQDPGVANPPSLLLPLAWLVSTALHPSSEGAQRLAERARFGSAESLRQLVVKFGTAALPRLAAWYAFLSRSQKSTHPGGCFKWAGRSAAHCLASGLDDYPRGLMVNDDECHLDLHAWMTLFAGTIARLCAQLASQGPVCREDWRGRSQTLNASLYELFAPKDDPSAPLADYLGKQPFNKGRQVVTPPWRSDGRCGPHFPPGDCDPYGGGPCCSPGGWCGGSEEFCECPGCRRSVPLEQRKDLFGDARPSHSPHLGYVSLFPVLLGLMPWEHPRARPLLAALQPANGSAEKKRNTLWSKHGVMSLSSGDPLFRKGEDYWRGKVWANMNYLAISALGRPGAASVAERLESAHSSLRQGFVDTVLGALRKQRFLFENFDPATGEGKGVGPFTGWTTLVVLVMADEPLLLDLEQLLGGE